MRKLKFGLFGRIVVAILLGVGLGFAFAHCGAVGDLGVRTFKTFNVLFAQVLKFIVPLLILGLVTPAIADTGKSAGRMLLLTMGVAYASTLFAGYFAYGVSCSVFPQIISSEALNAVEKAKEFPAFFRLPIPPIMDVTTALVTSFMLGLGIIAMKAETLAKAFGELRDIVTVTIAKAFVPFLPAYVLAVMADLTASGKLSAVGGGAVKIMGMALATTTAVLVLQYLVAGFIARKNPFKALWTMLPAYLTGWGCCSSAATIPYTLAQTKKNGVSDETASLVIPLCSSMHMAGSMANVVVYSAGLLVLMGQGLPLGAYTQYILLVSLVAVASPGVPGGVVLATQAIAESALGFSPERYAIMIAIYLALDGMGTACNLTGDGAIALIVDKFRCRKKV